MQFLGDFFTDFEKKRDKNKKIVFSFELTNNLQDDKKDNFFCICNV